MKLYTALSLVGITLGALGFAAQGCSSDDDAPGSPQADGGEQNGGLGRPPAPPEGAAAADLSQSSTFAVSAIFLGDSTREFAKDAKAWQTYGYNVDGKVSTAASTDVCTLKAGASSSVKQDGQNGIDNSFGSQIIPLIGTLVQNPSKTISDTITNDGAFTLLMTINGLDNSGSQSATGLTGDIRFGAPLGKAPQFGPTLDWPYRADAPIAISGGYINNGTFVNGEGGATIKLILAIQGKNLEVTINKATITFDHKSPDELTNGVISGVISTSELVESIGKVAGSIQASLCPGSSVFESLKSVIEGASDIQVDGSNAAGQECQAISVGIGFTAKRVAKPTTEAPPEEETPDPCADGGAGTADAGNDAGPADAGNDAGDQQ